MVGLFMPVKRVQIEVLILFLKLIAEFKTYSKNNRYLQAQNFHGFRAVACDTEVQALL